MGFALWIEDELAWAQGTHEYKPMGAAVIARNGVFSPRDFDRRRKSPYRYHPAFIGFFASMGDLNAYMKNKRRKRPKDRGMVVL
jgi:hypothetical protein